MASVSDAIYQLFGRKPADGEWTILFSARLDETGTDGRSPYTVVAGAVAAPSQWDKLESAWGQLLKRSRVSEYHWKEFNDRNNRIFGPWSDLKRKRFVDAQEKIVVRNTLFRVSIGLESAVHAEIKKRMKGIRGFTSESDYSLCLRYLMFATCEQLIRIDRDCRLAVMVEDGPWASGALNTYQRVAAMRGKWKPAKHAHRLAGFASVPKGERLSLEAADYLAGEEHARMLAGKRPKRGAQPLSLLLTAPLLERWYEGMIKEKEHRRAFRKRTMSSASSPEQPA